MRRCRMFHDHPDARGLFQRVHGDDTYSPQFEAHAQRVLGGLDNCISLLDDPATLAAELGHLHAQHAERSIKAEYYDVSPAIYTTINFTDEFRNVSVTLRVGSALAAGLGVVGVVDTRLADLNLKP